MRNVIESDARAESWQTSADARGAKGEARTGRPDNDDTRCAIEPQYTEDQLERGRKTLRRAERWRRNNPRAWAAIEARAARLAAKGERIGVQHLIEEMRWKDYTDVRGDPTRTNNSYQPVFARWLCLENPACARLIERRPSVFDALLATDGSRQRDGR